LFQIYFTREALERLHQIEKSDSKSARIILEHIRKLPHTYTTDPFLKGPAFKGLRRNRIGRYRAIYRVIESEKKIHIITIEHRKSIYD